MSVRIHCLGPLFATLLGEQPGPPPSPSPSKGEGRGGGKERGKSGGLAGAPAAFLRLIGPAIGLFPVGVSV